MILHIASQADWEDAERRGSYDGPTLAIEGFIHASRRSQVVEVANRWFRGRQDLVLLVIDEDRLSAEVRPENLEGGEELYPHIYGPVECEAVVEVLSFDPSEVGRFSPPAELLDADSEIDR